MGYFSELDAECRYSCSRGRPPLRRIALRLADLRSRREELIESGAPYRGWDRIPDETLAVVSPEYMTSVSETDRAIELALEEAAIAGGDSPVRIFTRSAAKRREARSRTA